MVFVLGTGNYTSIAVLTAIDGLFAHLVPNIRIRQLRLKPQLTYFFAVLTANDGLCGFNRN